MKLHDMVTEASAEMSESAAEFLRKRPSRMLIQYPVVSATVYTSWTTGSACHALFSGPKTTKSF